MRDILIALRPKQWVKNVALFAGLIFSQNFMNPAKVAVVFAAGFIFCIAASSVYLINDALDIEQDRRHPEKKFRPIASGALSVGFAFVLAALLMAWSIAMAFILNKGFLFFLSAYLFIEVLYSFYLKDIVILDLFCIAAGFLLRVLSGAVVIDVPISSWLLICTIFLSLFLALGKRRGEMVLLEDTASSHRQVLSDYSLSFIDQMITIVTASTVLSYVLYTLSPETVGKFHTKGLLFSVTFVIYGIFRYLYLIYQKKEGGSPERLLFSDKPLLISLVFYMIAVVLVIYFKGA
jgi:4-hydroxybenzoate polyprenyltransferase